MSDENLISLGEAAAILGVHPTTLRTWADKGDIATSRTAGGHRRFSRVDVETWSAARSRGGLPGASLVVDAALGRARFDLAEGRLNQEAWYSRLDAASRQAHRGMGRRLLALLLNYLSEGVHTGDLLAQARQLGAEYGQAGRDNGLTMAETVRAYLFFREYLHQSVYDALSATAVTPEALKAWRVLMGHVEYFTNEVLVAIVDAGRESER